MRTQQRPVVKQYKPQNGQQGCCDYDKLVNETCIIGYKKRLLSEVPSDWGVRITGTFAITNTESPASVGALGHSRCAALQSAAAVCHTDMKGGTRRLYSSPYWPLCTAGKCLKNILKLKWNTNSIVHWWNQLCVSFMHFRLVHSVVYRFLTPAPEPGCVIAAARGWTLWGTRRRRCLLSSWPRSSSCWVSRSVEGDGSETPCTNHSHSLDGAQLTDNMTPVDHGAYRPQTSLQSIFCNISFTDETTCFFNH